MTISVPGRWCVAAALATAVGVLLGTVASPIVACGAALLGASRPRWRTGAWVLAVLVVFGSWAGWAADRRSSAIAESVLPTGRVRLVLEIREDPSASTAWTAVGVAVSIDEQPWRGPRLGIRPVPAGTRAGDLVAVRGVIAGGVRRVGPEVVAGIVRADDVRIVGRRGGVAFTIGNALRSRVRSTFGADDQVDGLLTGLVIGDVERIPDTTMEDLRRSGLAHYVAVSGSNVALFLGAWWLVGIPLAISERTRAVYGIVGLLVFVVATRWEPSVVRASVMAAVPLLGGLASVPVDPWMALGVAVTVLLLVSADLIASVGFLLSVAATAGVLVGVSWVSGRRPGWLWAPLGATVGAQLAVAPIILAVFGSVPLVAPVTNLVAGPVVALSSGLAIGALALPFEPLVGLARTGAALVLRIAALGSDGPQLDALGVVGAVVVLWTIGSRRWRPMGLAAVAVVALTVVSSASPWPSVPTLVVLDIGQGDAMLLMDPTGRTALVDGGASPRTLDRALRRHGVQRLSLVVATHGDADHAAGLADVVRFAEVGELWVPAHTDDEVLDDLATEAIRRGIPVRRVAAGTRTFLGSIELEVLGPSRRYQSDNDGSVVILATAERSVLLAGDIEAVAQRELPDLDPDILVVPHHGSGTTSRAWLGATVRAVAVLSYGPNRFGHPHPEIVDILEESGATVFHTDRDGDVSLPLG